MTTRQIAGHLGGLVVLSGMLTLWYWSSTGSQALPGLTALLKDERPNVRIVAARGLATMGPAAKAAVPGLLDQALRDPVQDASAEAARTLKMIDLVAARQVMTAYLPRLAAKDPQARRTACVVLSSLGPVAKPAVPALLHAVKDPDDLVRDRAVRALGEIGIPAKDVMPALISALQDKVPHVRHAAATQFAFSGAMSGEAITALTELANDQDKSLALLAKHALDRASRDAKSDVAVLLTMVHQGSARDYALHQLAKLGPAAAEAVPAVIPTLKDDRAINRYLAAEVLYAIGPRSSEATSALIAALQDDDPVVSGSAVEALEAIGTPMAKAAAATYRKRTGPRPRHRGGLERLGAHLDGSLSRRPS